jgi:PAS domain S-box-containing protein
MTEYLLPAETSAGDSRGSLTLPHPDVLFRTLVEISTDSITIVDRDGILRYASPAIETVIGYAPAEVVGQPFAGFLHPEDLPRVARSFAEQFAYPDRPVRVETRVRHKDGSWRYTESISKLMLDGNVVAYTRDIGERREIDQALHAVAEGTAGVTGDDFFRSLVKHLATALGARYAFVAECIDTPPTQAHILAFWDGAAFGPDTSYDLASTPCEGVVAGQPCLYPHNLQALFPHNQALAEMGLQSYLGVPVFNAAGQVLGHLVVMDERPMQDDSRRTTILTIFAARAGAELERQRAETRLRQSEEHFRSIIENATDGIAIANRDGILTYVSPSFGRMLGYAAAELLGRSVAPLTHPDEGEQAMRDYLRMVEDPGQAVVSEGRLRHKNGEWRYIESSCVMLANGDILGNFRDISAKKQADAALRLAEQRFRAMFEQPLLMVQIYQPDGRIRQWNDASAQFFGVELGALATFYQTYNALKDPQMIALGLEPMLRRAMEGVPVSFPPTQYAFPDGRTIWAQAYMVPVTDDSGAVREVINVIQDITAQKAAEESLRHLNEQLEDRVAERTAALEAALTESRRLATVIEAMPDYIGMADLEGFSLYVNRAGKQMVGKTDADYAGRWHVTSCYPEWERARFVEVLEIVNRAGVWSGELEVLHKDGHTFPSDHAVFALRDTSGKIESYAAIIRDISERKRAEAELQQATAAAEAAAYAKSIFLANMSHEIRTPMNAVIGMTGLLLNTPLDDKQRDFVETIRAAGDSLLTIINDILDFSKIEAGKLTLERQTFDLRQCIESALDLLAPRAAEKGLDLAYVVDERTPAAIVGDVTRLRQILVNLLSNAIKFTEHGEVVVSVSTTDHRPLTTNPAASIAGGRSSVVDLHFSVKDTGIGIPPDKIDRLFQSFTQIDASTTRQFGGTGLGLAISKRLAELMGGTVWAESAGLPGRGATFHFSIQAEAAPAPVRVYLRGRRPELNGKRILVVDDHPTNRRIISLQTQTWGMVPTEAATPSEALALIQRGDPFDLAILDMQLPEMDGAALAAAICALRPSPRLPLIMLTSLGHDPHPSLEAVACFVAYLTKPVKPSQLYDVIIGALTIVPDQTEANTGAGLPEPEGHTSSGLTLSAQAPLRILLAEDVVVNQKFALLALEEMGYTADIAANGQEALTAMQRQPYDVILMDVQMPVMDGLEATRRIRALAMLQPYIIAMTANAMQGDREVCLEAGMDDYISKPVYPEELRMALKRAAEHRSTTTAQVTGRGPAPLDQAVVAQLLGRTRGRELLALYADESREIMRRLREAVARRDATAVRETAHSLKGSSQYVGASQVAALSGTLEQQARIGMLLDVEALVTELEHEFARACQTIAALPQLVRPQ